MFSERFNEAFTALQCSKKTATVNLDLSSDIGSKKLYGVIFAILFFLKKCYSIDNWFFCVCKNK